MSREAFPELARAQEILWRLITAPEGAAQGAAALVAEGSMASPDLGSLVRGSARQGATERVDVYADMYFYRLRDCLAEDFPRLADVAGAALFHDLVTDFLIAHPPAHYSLRELGRPFPQFLAQHAAGRGRPALGDLAALEWARVDVFDEADADGLARDALVERGGAQPEMRLGLAPAARLLRVRAVALGLWTGASAADADVDTAVGVRVWRRGSEVCHCSVEDDELACLSALAEGGTRLDELGEIVAEHRGAHASPEAAGARLASLLAGWADAGLLVDAAS